MIFMNWIKKKLGRAETHKEWYFAFESEKWNKF